ncbi:MAG: hypothetical protein WBD31_12240 [Rubripirellula sp.]
MLNRPGYLLLSLLIATLVGSVMASWFHRKQHEATGKLLYTPNRVAEPFYVSPPLSDLVDTVVGPALLSELREHCDVAEELDELSDRIRFHVTSDSVLDVSYRSPDRRKAEAVVQQAMELFLSDASELRAGAIAQHLDDSEREIQHALIRNKADRDRLSRTIWGTGAKTAAELANAISGLRQSISRSMTRIAIAKDREQLIRSQTESLVDTIASKQSADGASVSAESASDVALTSFEGRQREPTPVDDLHQQQLLEGKIRYERARAAFKAQVEATQKEFDRSKSLHDRDLISDAVFEKAKGDLQVLLAQQSTQVKSMEAELEAIYDRTEKRTEKRIEDRTQAGRTESRPRSSGTALDQASEQPAIAMLRNYESAAGANLKKLQEQVDAERGKLRNWELLQIDVAPAQRKIESAEQSLERLNRKSELLGQASRSDISELVIVQKAMPKIGGVSTNAKSLFVTGFVASLGCLLVPLLLSQIPSSDHVKRQDETIFGLTVLGRQTASSDQAGHDLASSDDDLSRLAIRICRKFGKLSGVITIASQSHGQGDGGIVPYVARELQSDGRKTVVMDSSDLVNQDAVKVAAGRVGTSGSSEPLLGRKLSFSEVKSQSDYVLVSAPMFGNALHLEASAIRSDAVVLVTPIQQSQSPQLQKAVTDLTELGVPILGIVVTG